MAGQVLLQLCPHDSAPFGPLVEIYEQAAHSLGLRAKSIFLSRPGAQPVPGAIYLEFDDLTRTADLSRALDREVGAAADLALVLCHRYRSYWAAVRSRLPAHLCVAVAHEYGLLGRWQRRLNRRLFARRVRFAGVSGPVAEELAAVTGHRLVLPNALDAGAQRGALLTAEAARAELGLPARDFVVGVIGRLHYKKRPQLALQAFSEFAETHKGASQLAFLGDGKELPLLTARAPENARFLGVVPAAWRYFAAFDAVLYPAQADSFGMVALEAMNAGVPVVCKPRHGPADVLGELGFYADEDSPAGFARALSRAAGADREVLLRAGRQRVDQHFSTAAVARTLDDLLVAGGQRSGYPP